MPSSRLEETIHVGGAVDRAHVLDGRDQAEAVTDAKLGRPPDHLVSAAAIDADDVFVFRGQAAKDLEEDVGALEVPVPAEVKEDLRVERQPQLLSVRPRAFLSRASESSRGRATRG